MDLFKYVLGYIGSETVLLLIIEILHDLTYRSQKKGGISIVCKGSCRISIINSVPWDRSTLDPYALQEVLW